MKHLNDLKLLALSLLFCFGLTGCGGGTGTGNPEVTVEDTSTSGTAASAVGGALSGSSNSGTLASNFYRSQANPSISHRAFHRVYEALNLFPKAFASLVCPTFKTTGSDCSTNLSSMWLDYSDCSFGSSLAVWNGTQALVMSAGSASCGTFPNPGDSASLVRQFVNGAGSTTPTYGTVTTSFGTSVTFDNATANLGNFNGDIIPTILHGGYGASVQFNASGARSALSLGERVTGKLDGILVVDQTPTTDGTPLTITETPGASSRTVSGSLKVYHNLFKIIGTSQFNSVVHTDGCCFPTQGSIKTTFSAGTTPPSPIVQTDYVGKSETLTFTGCGTATYVNVFGNSSNVTLSHCM